MDEKPNYGPIFARRSVRKYRADDVPDAQIAEIIRAGIAAPPAKNRQPWKCVVLKNAPKAEFLARMEAGLLREQNGRAALPKSARGLADAHNTLEIMRAAPVVIAVVNTNGKSPFAPLDADERFTEICDSLSIGAFIENMLLQAAAMGVGSLWVANTCFAYEELSAWLGEAGQLAGAVVLGYADEAPAARPRKSLDEIVKFRQ